MRSNLFVILFALFALQGCATQPLRGTGDLGVVVERDSGKLQIVDTTARTILGEISGLGDLSHATVVFSRDQRYAYVFGRDGGLTKVDILRRRIVKRVLQSGNSIGGAISQDGRLIAAANYTPGGVKFFRSDTLAQVADIPAIGADGKRSKVVGLVSAPGDRFVFSLYNAGEIWTADMKAPAHPVIHKFTGVGKEPYDGIITPDGRYYLAGLFGEDGMALLDLWHLPNGVKRILNGYGKGSRRLPVYKMPHLEGWGFYKHYAFVPAVGHHEVLVIDTDTWRQAGVIPTYGQPVFVVGQPYSRHIWVDFAFPDNGAIQVIDAPTRRVIRTLKPGKGVLFLEFTPRGENVWVSARDSNKLVVYDTATFRRVTELPSHKPSGIFFTPRAYKLGW
ncbi:MAG TPA: protein nirF [Betaproteobacteria bacterium]|nr:protein nirF [Betaproteobacteria bacterium]